MLFAFFMEQTSRAPAASKRARESLLLELAQTQITSHALLSPGLAAFIDAPVAVSASEGQQISAQTVTAAGVTIELSDALLSLSPVRFRQLLAAGWKLLSDADRNELSKKFLPVSVTAEDVLVGPQHFVSLFGGHPVDVFLLRAQSGLLHPTTIALQTRLASLVRRVRANERAAVASQLRSSTEPALRLFAYLAGNVANPLQLLPPQLTPAQQQQMQQQLQEENYDTDDPDEVPPSSSVPSSEKKRARSPPSSASRLAKGDILSRTQKKTQSRLASGVLNASYRCFIRMRDIMRSRQPLRMSDFEQAVLQDGCFERDPVEPLTVGQLVKVAVKFLCRQTPVVKGSYGPYLVIAPPENVLLQWADDSKMEEVDAMLELEGAEKFFRFVLSRGWIDVNTGVVNSMRMSDLKNSITTLRKMPPEVLTEFHRQERERFEPHNVLHPYTYRLGNMNSIVGAQRTKAALSKLPRKHPLLIDDRPNTVAVQDIVRDALARLPQGVGTKGDLQLLITDSQFVIPDAQPQALAATLSDSLDRLSAANDPAAIYHHSTKLWSYLHRGRKPQDFLPPEDD